MLYFNANRGREADLNPKQLQKTKSLICGKGHQIWLKELTEAIATMSDYESVD